MFGSVFPAHRLVAQQGIKDSLAQLSIHGSATVSPLSTGLFTARTAVLSGFSLVPADNYVKNLAFFCRQENKFEKVVKIPLRFRMGSLEQCNKLEGK